MINIVINRFNIEILRDTFEINLYEENITNYMKRIKPSNLYRDLEKIRDKNKIMEWFNSQKKDRNEPYIFYSFYHTIGAKEQISIRMLNNNFKKQFIKETLIEELLSKGLLVEPYKEGCDFCVYQKYENKDDNGLEKRIRYDFVIHCYYDSNSNRQINEISVSIGSQNTYFTNLKVDEIKPHTKVVYKNLLLQYNEVKSLFNSSNEINVKADNEIRKKRNISSEPQFQFYKKYYDLISKFVRDYFSTFNNGHLKIYPHFKKILESEIQFVSFDSNKMVFGANKTDYNAIHGMRDYGPYKKPVNIDKIKLLFIYPDSDSANKLFQYFLRGYRHFPGLESYVGIPSQPSEIKIKYDIKNITELPQRIEKELPEPQYENHLAICLMPFSKSNANIEQSKIYYKIKEVLLKKNIPSQFIESNKIFSENFHFYLPNISIAMLAKLGGVPWKLQSDDYNQLVVGFNIFKNKNNSFIGSIVYFDNKGLLKGVEGFKKEDSIKKVTELIQNFINSYQKENNTLKSIVIHYFKPPSNKEKRNIEQMLFNELKLGIPIAFVEINDTKTTTDICFDLDYVTYMPKSGMYVRLKPNEYLLFNNLRYSEKPINPVKIEEYPIKVKIYDPSDFFSHDQLISQVYEFSRLYWKGLKQKAQPVTTLYSKLIAEYVSHFENNTVPQNPVSKNTIWFI